MKETRDGLVGNSGSFSSTWSFGSSTASQVVEHGAGTSGINAEHPLLSTTSASWTSAVTFSKCSKSLVYLISILCQIPPRNTVVSATLAFE